jgi:flagellar basal-body rod protein FlgB
MKSGFFHAGIDGAKPGRETRDMIDALFAQPNYLAAKKGLDLVELRQRAIQDNLANLETPGYKRMDVAPSFSSALERAIATRDPHAIDDLKPELVVDSSAVATSPDGNTVDLERELLEMNKNSLTHTMQTQLITGSLMRLKLAINGKPT